MCSSSGRGCRCGRRSWRTRSGRCRSLVDGPIDCVTVTDDLAIVCNEEGRLRGLSPSASILRMQFVGPVAFVGVRGENFMSITRKGERLVRQIVREAEL